ncbi:hypothetical protein [uncultured Jannaschia sp.]|uniref:hypothetical protein n=1 Tax=uncultured Jannaschia sp. TaxID=293347 RepID=UPI002603F56E|nr:hypothetical protein [uncultured Jannaschia sp.]
MELDDLSPHLELETWRAELNDKYPSHPSSRSPFARRLALFALLMPPYLAAVWAAGTYDDLIATPWTIGWAILWMGLGPILGIVAGVFLAVTPVLSIATIVGLIIAVPFYPQALTVLLTLFGSFFVSAPPVWITLAVLISGITVAIYWTTGLSW